MDFTTLIGTSGATIILIAFVLNQINIWKNESIYYDSFNSVGGVLMTAYAFLLGSWPFFILNAVWAVVSIKDVVIYINNHLKNTQH